MSEAPVLPSLDDVYCKFGEASEAAQILETDLGTLMLFHRVVDEGILKENLECDGERAAVVMNRINRQTLGQLVNNARKKTQSLDQIEALLTNAISERNRLAHTFYREHNFRRNSGEGRALMMEDLERIHKTLLDAVRAMSLLSGTDLDEMAAKGVGGLIGHLPI